MRFEVLACAVLMSSVSTAAQKPQPSLKPLAEWAKGQRLPMEAKIAAKAPGALIDYLRWDNQKNGWPNIPQAVELTDSFKNDLLTAIRGLPADVVRKVNEKLIGIYVVSDLGGSAYTEKMELDDKKNAAGFVVLDVTALNRTANQWATWKESSPFRLGGKTQIRMEIEKPENETRANAIQYILLHEFGHILNIGSRLMPGWGSPPRDLLILPSMRFFNLSWTVQENKFTSRYDDIWFLRPKIHFYAQPEDQLEASAVLGSYKHLLMTNFPTLYAATHPGDDFAESFVNYVHVVRMKKPWSVVISAGTETLTVKDCWQETRCQEKRKLLEELLAP